MARTAIVLFNLGGPDGPEAVRPFLYNLFADPAILRMPWPFRQMVAWLIAKRRAPVARDIYDKIGGRSPIMPETETQAAALAEILKRDNSLGDLRIFIAMRYWHPMSYETAEEVKRFDPDHVIALPLYPHFSTSTTESSLKAWRRAADQVGLTASTTAVCCYPTEAGLIAALARLTKAGLDDASKAGTPRILFSAHGLPKKFVAKGDPYQAQIEQCAAAILDAMGGDRPDHVICYQSRVGPVEWLRPYTDDEVRRAGADHRPIVVVPLAFVSEHSETLVELDIEYRHLAEQVGVPAYIRVPTVNAAPEFIEALAGLVRRGMAADTIMSGAGHRVCPESCGACPIPVAK